MSFYAHIAPNFVSSSAALGYDMLPMVSTTAVLDTVYSDLSSSVASGTNNGWVIWDDLRAWDTGTILADTFGPAMPFVTIAANGFWNEVVGQGINYWQISSASLSWTGYWPWGRDFKWSISCRSDSPTDVSFDSGTTWYKAYFAGSGSVNYSTATLDRPFSASAGVTTYPYQVLQRNFKYLVIRQNSSAQKKFCVLLAAAQDRTGGPHLYTRIYEGWDAVNHSGVGLGSSWESHRTMMFGTSSLSTQMRLMTWYLPEAFVIWTGGIPDPTMGERQQLTYVGNLEAPLSRTDPDALAFIPGETTYSGYGFHGTAAVQVTSEGMGFQCLRTVGGRPWSTPIYTTGSHLDNCYQLWPRSRNINFAAHNYQRDYQGRFLYTDLDVWHVGASTQPYMYNGLINEGVRGRLRYAKSPVGNPNGLQFSTVSASDGHRYIFVRQSAPFYGSNATTTTWGNSEPANNGSSRYIMSGWGFNIEGNGTSNNSIGDIWPYTSPIGGFYNYLMLPVDI